MLSQVKQCLGLLDRRTHLEAVLLVVCLFVVSLMEAAVVGAIFPLIQTASEPSRLFENESVRALAEAVGWTDARSVLLAISLGFLLLFLVKNVFVALTAWWRCRFAFKNEALLAGLMLKRYLDSPYEIHLRRSSADLINSVQVSVKQAFTHVLLEGLNVASEILVVVSIVLVLLVMEPAIALSTAVALGLGIIVIHRLMHRPFAMAGERSIGLQKRCLQLLQQAIGGIKELKVLGREGFFTAAYAAAREAYAHLTVVSTVLNQLPRLALETVTVAAVFIVVLAVTAQGRDNADVIAVLGLFGAAAFRLMPSMNRIVVSLNQMRYGTAAVDAIYADIKAPVEAERVTAKDIVSPLESEIRLDQVSFTYHGERASALRDVALSIRRGESIGLVGASGAGKTTLADILLGLLPPTEGRLLIDGNDAWSDVGAWRRQTGYVPQSIYLLEDTIRRNVALGLVDGEIDEAKVWQALRLAQMEEFVRGLPAGLDTQIGELGSRLSGGQRQRIGIARALYGDPAVLVLDEATSALDSATERAIGEAMERLRGVKTLITIAHRISTVRQCDRLVFVKDGRIAAAGSFERLMADSAEFRETVRLASLQPADVNNLAQAS